MKTAQYIRNTIFLTLFTIGLIFNGCSNDNPVAISGGETTGEQNIKFIKLFDSNSLNKVTSTQKWISRNSGGTLHMHHMQNNAPWSEVIVDLRVPAYSIDYSKNISATYDDAVNTGEADLVFGPHGTKFSKPALLSIECKNFDLSGINPNDIKFYYLNPNGQWQEHPTHEIVVSIEWGIIRVIDAQIPHFSRYAIGME